MVTVTIFVYTLYMFMGSNFAYKMHFSNTVTSNTSISKLKQSWSLDFLQNIRPWFQDLWHPSFCNLNSIKSELQKLIILIQLVNELYYDFNKFLKFPLPFCNYYFSHFQYCYFYCYSHDYYSTYTTIST